MPSYIIEGSPKALKRPRFSNKSGKVYDSQRAEKNADIAHLRKNMDYIKPDCPSKDDVLSVNIFYCMPIPASFSKKRREELLRRERYHTSRPDISNLIKYTEDVLQDAGIIFDDSQIVEIRATKKYSEEPATHILISTIN